MPETFYLALAFLLGYLVRIAVERNSFKVRYWLKRHVPRRCPLCGTWSTADKMMIARHKIKGLVCICHECYDAEFTPFSKKANHE